MPRARAILPYLDRVDESRIYSNFGALVLELERRLAQSLGISPSNIVTVANATVGLTLALLAKTDGRRGACLMPAWTFAATAHAITAAGLEPVLIDVDEGSWSLEPQQVREAIGALGAPIAAVLPVVPFGQPYDPSAWDEFTQDTGIPVVIDAAAAHDTACIGRSPSVVSLHATKLLGAGEGGYVISSDADLIVEVKKRSNFGFFGSRNAQVLATNGKMSEYHAAVGLASLDSYPVSRESFVRVARMYRQGFAGANQVRLQPGFGDDWIGSVCMVRVPGGDAAALTRSLADQGVDTRAWWGAGIHRHSAFSKSRRVDLSVTERLAAETIGLPFFVDMPAADAHKVVRALLNGLGETR